MPCKPKPTNLKILQGNPSGRPLNTREPKPKMGIPTPPDVLSKEALAEWDRLSPYLLRTGLITEADRAAFAAYCQAYGRWIEAERVVATQGECYTSDKGNIVQNPWLWVANRALEQMYKFLGEFGLTPSSRSKLSINPGTEDEMDEYLKRGEMRKQQAQSGG